MHPRMQARVKDVATQKMLSKEESIILSLKTIALISEVEFNKTGFPLFRMISDVALKIIHDLSNFSLNTEDGLNYRKKVKDELRLVQESFETLIAAIRNLSGSACTLTRVSNPDAVSPQHGVDFHGA